MSKDFVIICLTLYCLGIALSIPLSERVTNPEFLDNNNDDHDDNYGDDDNNNGDPYRLPGNIEPLVYDITLKPYFTEPTNKKFTFDGEVFIDFFVKRNLNKILIHMKDLEIIKAEYKEKNSNKIHVLNEPSVNFRSDIATYVVNEELMENATYTLHFTYNGTLSTDMHGFYRSSYLDNNNNPKWLASTQFQTHHARRAFPCFDEPKYKAIFSIKLKRQKNMKTVSNTAIFRTNLLPDGYYEDEYMETPKMSPYIVAFTVSEFNERTDGIFSIIARPDFYDQTNYSFHVAQPILKYLSTYLGNPYFQMGIDKMHMAAIPDFSAGAMENWGLMTFRERVLLYDKSSTTLAAKQSIASTVAHEEAHMWFGDLVTCDWWSYTWLNEGFARYFQYFATAAVEKEFHLDRQFVLEQVFLVMEKDATVDTNPLTNPNTNTHQQISQMFNSISYNKGAAFIRMVKFAIGESNFAQSLQEYLEKYKYKTAVPENLFDIWKKYFPEENMQYADNLFHSFTNQVGYPVISVYLNGDNVLEISQNRFVLNSDDGSDTTLRYTVPITFTTSEERDFCNTTPKLYLTPLVNTIQYNLERNVKWVIANIQTSGYYRVNYDKDTWYKIREALSEDNWGGIHEQNRAQIVHDVLNLARAEMINYTLAFNMIEYLKNETAYLPWAAAFDALKFLTIRLGDKVGKLGLYIRNLSADIYNSLGFEENITDESLDIYNRENILSWSCKYGSEDCIKKTTEYFNKNLNIEPIPVNIRSHVYCTAMRNGNSNDFDKLFQMYTDEMGATEKTLILKRLSCVKDKELVIRLFNLIMSDAIRSQDKLSTLTSLFSENNENVEVVFDLITNNMEKVATEMGGYFVVATIVETMALRFTEESQLSKLKEFNQKHENAFGSSTERLKLAEETVAKNLEWSKRNLAVIIKYLDEANAGSLTTLFISLHLLSMLHIFV